MSDLEFVRIERDGTASLAADKLPAIVAGAVAANVALYARNDAFTPPWVSYLARRGDDFVGTCAFPATPAHGRVEIAYYTFPGFERQGLATEMARWLVATARAHDASLTLVAHTLPETNPSTRILEKLGFTQTGMAQDPDEGSVWEWELPPTTP